MSETVLVTVDIKMKPRTPSKIYKSVMETLTERGLPNVRVDDRALFYHGALNFSGWGLEYLQGMKLDQRCNKWVERASLTIAHIEHAPKSDYDLVDDEC